MYKLTNKVPIESGYYWTVDENEDDIAVVRFVVEEYGYSIYYPGSDEPFYFKDFSMWSERIEEPELDNKI
jgi:hypothetical protein